MTSTGKTKGGHRGEQGFSLIELLIALALIVVLLTLAAPNVGTFIKNNRRAAQVNDFIASLQNARSEAVTRGVSVSICKNSNSTAADVPATPAPACQSTTWERGWFVFVDDDGDGRRDGNEQLLRAVGPLSSDNTLRSDTGTGIYSISYDPDGAITGNPSSGSSFHPRFRLCDSRGASESRLIEMSMSGRPRAGAEATQCP